MWRLLSAFLPCSFLITLRFPGPDSLIPSLVQFPRLVSHSPGAVGRLLPNRVDSLVSLSRPSSRVHTPAGRQQPFGAGPLDPHPSGDRFVLLAPVSPISSPLAAFCRPALDWDVLVFWSTRHPRLFLQLPEPAANQWRGPEEPVSAPCTSCPYLYPFFCAPLSFFCVPVCAIPAGLLSLLPRPCPVLSSLCVGPFGCRLLSPPLPPLCVCFCLGSLVFFWSSCALLCWLCALYFWFFTLLLACTHHTATLDFIPRLFCSLYSGLSTLWGFSRGVYPPCQVGTPPWCLPLCAPHPAPPSVVSVSPSLPALLIPAALGCAALFFPRHGCIFPPNTRCCAGAPFASLWADWGGLLGYPAR